jgi:hypothetical protein
MPLKNSEIWAPQKSRQIGWRKTFHIQCPLEFIAAVFSGFSTKSAGPPYLSYTNGSKGLQNFEQGSKKSFSTASVKNTRSGIGRFAPNRAIVRGDIGGRQELVGEDYSSRRRHQPPCQG